MKVNNSIHDNYSGTPPGRNFTIAGSGDVYLAQSSTHAENDFYRFVVENVNEGIILINHKGEHIYRNPSVERMTGYTFSELNGKTIFDFVHPDEAESARQVLEEVTTEPDKVVVKQYRILTKQGSYIWVECTCKNMLHTPEVKAIIINYRDITLRKKVEKEIQHLNYILEKKVKERTQELAMSNDELEAFNYSVSHDVRTSIRTISGYARMVEKKCVGLVDTEGAEMLRKISDEAMKISELMNNLTKLSMASKKELERSIVNMQHAAETAYQEVLSTQATNAKIQINQMDSVNGDAKLLKQVIVNLLSNAIKYSGKKEDAKVELGSEHVGDAIVYYVKDNGDGFDQENAAKLFKPFSRLHSDEEFEGTGVGLSIVDRIVKRHGGEVWARGSKGNGASFFFSLPIKN